MFDLIEDSWILIFASVLNLLQYGVMIKVYGGNRSRHKYVDGNGKNV